MSIRWISGETMLFRTRTHSVDFTEMTAVQAARAIRHMSGRRRQRAITRLLYKRSARPAALEEQRSLLLMLSSDETLKTSDRLNALVAGTHKSIEMDDLETCRALLPQLELALDAASRLPDTAAIRESGTHVGTSICYAMVLAAILDGAETYADRTKPAHAFLASLETARLSEHFFRTVSNFARCHALLACGCLRKADRHGAEVSLFAVERALIAAVRVRRAPRKGLTAFRRFRAEPKLPPVTLSKVRLNLEDMEYLRAHSIRNALHAVLQSEQTRVEQVLRLSVPDAMPSLADRLVIRFEAM